MQPKQLWLDRGEPLEVEVTARDTKPGSATVYRQTLDKSQRRARAIKGLLICWLLALLSLPILFFHFFLVPMFLAAGLVLFALRMREEHLVLGAVVTCPACGEPSKLGRQAEEWPLGMSCGPCGKQLELSVAANSSDGGVEEASSSLVPPCSLR